MKFFLIEDWGYDGLSITPFDTTEKLKKAMDNTGAFRLDLILGDQIKLKYKKTRHGTIQRKTVVEILEPMDTNESMESYGIAKHKLMKELFSK